MRKTENPPSATGGRAILLVNLGSPDSPTVPDVRRYLNQFLMDPRVIDAPWPIRRMIVSLTILPRRPRESAKAYRKIWRADGSPLIVISRRVRQLLQDRIDAPVGLGMRYGRPSIEEALRSLIEADRHLEEIYLIALYPHYAMSSHETVVVEVRRVMKKLGSRVRLRVHPPFYDDPLYIDAMVANAREYLDRDYDHLLFSYHGIPERHVRKSDPTASHCLQVENCCHVDSPAHATCYRAQVHRTTEAFAKKAALREGTYSLSFQSRLGRDPWLKPYTDFEFKRLAERGVKKMLVISPAFVSDCLETLEELGLRGRADFIKAGGQELTLIPCMNEHPRWIDALAAWCAP